MRTYVASASRCITKVWSSAPAPPDRGAESHHESTRAGKSPFASCWTTPVFLLVAGWTTSNSTKRRWPWMSAEELEASATWCLTSFKWKAFFASQLLDSPSPRLQVVGEVILNSRAQESPYRQHAC